MTFPKALVETVAAAIWALQRDTDCNDYGQLSKPAKELADQMAVAALKAEAAWKKEFEK